MERTRKNTIKIAFAVSARAPGYLDVLHFVGNTLFIPASSVHSLYKDENDRCFYLKFLEESQFEQFVNGIEEQYVFAYTDGSRTTVKIEVASTLFRYVRIFNLPPEVEDKEIAAALGQFGTIRQHVREKFPADYAYPVYSGIRGVHMELTKEPPANMYIAHFKVRIYYEGLKNRCFYCKIEGHLKVNCPKLASVRAGQNGGQGNLSGSSNESYSQVLVNAALAASSSSTHQPAVMTTFSVPNTKRVIDEERSDVIEEKVNIDKSGDQSELSEEDGGDGLTDEIGETEVEKQTLKRVISSESSELDKRQKKRKAKKKDQPIASNVSPIEAIGLRTKQKI